MSPMDPNEPTGAYDPPQTLSNPGGDDVTVDGRHIGVSEAHAALHPGVGEGTPSSAPVVLPPGEDGAGALQPVRLYGQGPAAVLAIAGAIVALGVGEPIVALACAAGLVIVFLLLELVRAKVTPIAKPQLASGIPLTPDDELTAAEPPTIG